MQYGSPLVNFTNINEQLLLQNLVNKNYKAKPWLEKAAQNTFVINDRYPKSTKKTDSLTVFFSFWDLLA